MVVLMRDHRGWNLENRGVATIEPVGAQALQSRRRRIATPIPRKSVRIDCLFLHVARQLDLDLNEVSWYEVLVRKHQDLESGQRYRRRGIDDAPRFRMPAPRGEKATPTAQWVRGVLLTTDAPQIHWAHLAVDSVTNAQENLFYLSFSDLGIEEAERRLSR